MHPASTNLCTPASTSSLSGRSDVDPAQFDHLINVTPSAAQDTPLLEPKYAPLPETPAVPASYASHETATLLNSCAVIVGAVLGIGLGLLLSKLHVSGDVEEWLALPGTLFVRALRCLIVPLVFCTLLVSVAEIVLLNKASILTWRTAALFYTTSLLSTLQGMAAALVYKRLLRGPSEAAATNTTTTTASLVVGLQCAGGGFMAMLPNGSIACTAVNATGAALFSVNDIHQVLSTATTYKQLSLTEQVIGIINVVVPENIFAALAKGSLLSTITFALMLGVAIAKAAPPSGENDLLVLFRHCRRALLVLIHAVLWLTPVAVCSLLATSIVSYSAEHPEVVAHGGLLVLCFVVGLAAHVLVVLPTFLYLVTRENPYKYLRQLLPAYVFAFGCASSMATLPVSVTVVHQTRQVSRRLAQVLMCLGTPVNLNTPGMYYPLVTVFLANAAGATDQLGAPELVVLFFVSFLGCVGTAPVPNAGLVMQMTVWKTVLPNVPLPSAFVYLVAIDVLIDRIGTAANVHGNMVATRAAAEYADDSWGSE
ncbi:dicarboxylate/amino acid:cation (Na or H) symporter (DAACS) family protein [Achlya hypogyna]|uniref:Amino acid transporter n=1 Tax=Achlya hypogyna TaxID=1202772 RepID=A0A1V9ZNX9_ACHHY|nr:dicarboxylate/amino acid:cation (Na or H) symporter (DAACS) family protein [Achlya hypogyna]